MLNAHAAVGPALSRVESTSAQNWASALQCRSQARSNVRYGSEELQKEKQGGAKGRRRDTTGSEYSPSLKRMLYTDGLDFGILAYVQ